MCNPAIVIQKRLKILNVSLSENEKSVVFEPTVIVVLNYELVF